MRSVYLRADEAPRSPRIFKKRLRAPEGGPARPGEVVALRTADGRFVARAFYNPRSVIAARVLDRAEDGPPVDGAWIAARLRAAADLRTKVLRLPDITDAWRLVHAEGDGLSGLVIDKYADIAVVEVGARGWFERLDDLEDALREVTGVREVVVRADPAVEKIEGFRVRDVRAAPAETVITEHGLRFHVDARGGHKTGFFLDQRDARAFVAGLARGRRVLDLCTYTGGFALAAARGGALAVRAVDLDEDAIAQARRNAAENGLAVDWVHADAFDELRATRDGELIVLDPPKLAPDRRSLGRARKKSVDFHTLAFQALRAGGLLATFSCTGLFDQSAFESQVREGARRAGRTYRTIHEFGQPGDHPVHVDAPEGRYLRGVLVVAD